MNSLGGMGQGIDLGRGGQGMGHGIDLGRGGQGLGQGINLGRGGLGGMGRGGKREVKLSLENTGFKGDFEISDIKAGRDQNRQGVHVF